MTKPFITESSFSYYAMIFDESFAGHGIAPPPAPSNTVVNPWSFDEWGYHPEVTPPMVDVLFVHETGYGYDIYSERSWQEFFKTQADIDQLKTREGSDARLDANEELIRKFVRRVPVLGENIETPNSREHVAHVSGKTMTDQNGNVTSTGYTCVIQPRFSFDPKPQDWRPFNNPAVPAPNVPWRDNSNPSKPEFDGARYKLIEPVPGQECLRNPRGKLLDFSDPNLATFSVIEQMLPDLQKSTENIVESNMEEFYNGGRIAFGRDRKFTALTETGFEVRTPHPDNLRMRIEADEGEINTQHLRLSTEFDNVSWGSEDLYFNPLMKFFPPTAAMPYNLMLPVPDKDLQLLKPLLELS